MRKIDWRTLKTVGRLLSSGTLETLFQDPKTVQRGTAFTTMMLMNDINQLEYGERIMLLLRGKACVCEQMIEFQFFKAHPSPLAQPPRPAQQYDPLRELAYWLRGVQVIPLYLLPPHFVDLRAGRSVLLPANCPACHRGLTITLKKL